MVYSWKFCVWIPHEANGSTRFWTFLFVRKVWHVNWYTTYSPHPSHWKVITDTGKMKLIKPIMTLIIYLFTYFPLYFIEAGSLTKIWVLSVPAFYLTTMCQGSCISVSQVLWLQARHSCQTFYKGSGDTNFPHASPGQCFIHWAIISAQLLFFFKLIFENFMQHILRKLSPFHTSSQICSPFPIHKTLCSHFKSNLFIYLCTYVCMYIYIIYIHTHIYGCVPSTEMWSIYRGSYTWSKLSLSWQCQIWIVPKIGVGYFSHLPPPS